MLMVNNNSANSNGMWMPLTEVPLPEELKNGLEDLDISYDDFQKQPDEYAMEDPRIDLALQAEAGKWIASHPIAFIKLGLMRIQATFFSAENAGDIYSWAINSGRMGGGLACSGDAIARHPNFFKNIPDGAEFGGPAFCSSPGWACGSDAVF
jgi:hypothetical protein